MALEFLRDLWGTVQAQFSLVDHDDIVEKQMDDSLESIVEQARRDWVNAKTFFDNVVDPELVDYAVYSIEAAERKYVYLLNKARATRP
ncbi:MAG: YaaL family protein [Firmicutes bacterium]|nr:YaaL family protein [Bacillota bacterium]